jgi:hypothetical protein
MSRLSLGLALASIVALTPAVASAQTAAPAPYPVPYPPTATPYGVAPTGAPQGFPAYGTYEYPARLDWEEGRPAPPGYHTRSRNRRGLIISGAVTFGALYMLSILTVDSQHSSTYEKNHEYDALYVPGIGPFLVLSKVENYKGITLLDGFGQCAGLIMFASGFAFPTTEIVRNDLGVEVHLLPNVGKDSQGLSLLGTF